MATNKMACPRCGSYDTKGERHLSLTGAVVGGFLLGPLGALAGATSSDKKELDWKCQNCGKTWRTYNGYIQ